MPTQSHKSYPQLPGLLEADVLWLCLSASKRGAQVPYSGPRIDLQVLCLAKLTWWPCKGLLRPVVSLKHLGGHARHQRSLLPASGLLKRCAWRAPLHTFGSLVSALASASSAPVRCWIRATQRQLRPLDSNIQLWWRHLLLWSVMGGPVSAPWTQQALHISPGLVSKTLLLPLKGLGVAQLQTRCMRSTCGLRCSHQTRTH